MTGSATTSIVTSGSGTELESLDAGGEHGYRALVVRVAQRGRYSVYVYDEAGERHHLPHCHVRWSDGGTQVSLPSLAILRGDDLPSVAEEMLRDNLEELRRVWNLLNPERQIT